MREFICSACGFPNAIEFSCCQMCGRDEVGNWWRFGATEPTFTKAQADLWEKESKEADSREADLDNSYRILACTKPDVDTILRFAIANGLTPRQGTELIAEVDADTTQFTTLAEWLTAMNDRSFINFQAVCQETILRNALQRIGMQH